MVEGGAVYPAFGELGCKSWVLSCGGHVMSRAEGGACRKRIPSCSEFIGSSGAPSFTSPIFRDNLVINSTLYLWYPKHATNLKPQNNTRET